MHACVCVRACVRVRACVCSSHILVFFGTFFFFFFIKNSFFKNVHLITQAFGRPVVVDTLCDGQDVQIPLLTNSFFVGFIYLC